MPIKKKNNNNNYFLNAIKRALKNVSLCYFQIVDTFQGSPGGTKKSFLTLFPQISSKLCGALFFFRIFRFFIEVS